MMRLSFPACTYAYVCTYPDSDVFLASYRAVIERNPRKLQWKTPTHGPLIRPYRLYKEVQQYFSIKKNDNPHDVATLTN